MKVDVNNIETLIFSSKYNITVKEIHGSAASCEITGDIAEFEKVNAGKYINKDVVIKQEPIKQEAVVKLPEIKTSDIQAIIQEKVMTSVAVSYGLQEGLKLWSATITPYEKIDTLTNISEYERVCIKTYYTQYQNAVILPKYITMLAGVGAAVWAYINPYLISFINAVL